MAELANAKIDMRVLTEQLEEAKTSGPKGVSFDAFAVRELESVLQTCVRFHPEVPELERHRIIHSGIFRAGEKGVITKDNLLPTLTRLEQEYLRRTISRFTLVTTLSVAYGRHLRAIHNDTADIRFHAHAPRRYQRRPGQRATKWPAELDPPEYTVVTVSINARDAYSAYERGVAALNQARAPWNYALNRQILTTLMPDTPRPINKIRIGPYQTVHDQAGKLAIQSYWYEQLQHHYAVVDLRRGWSSLQHDAIIFRRLLRKHPYRADVENAAVRYVRALDSAHFDAVFLELWGVLELLTHTIGGKYDQTIRRTLFLFKHVEHSRLILEHLRTYRNAIVHHGASRSEAEIYTYQLKRYVEDVFSFHLAWRGRFKSLAEFGEYLELATESEDLKRQLQWYKSAVKFRGA